MDGDSDTVSPSNSRCQSTGLIGVTTLLPQPQAHLCTAVAYGIET